MNKIYLGLGSNLGNKTDNLKKAINLIKNFPKTKIVNISKVYETKAWGYTKQDNFLNLCLEIKSNLSPKELLRKCQSIENKLKRERDIKWGPRTIDIDILIYQDFNLDSKELTLPHPRIKERAFVIWPLLDLNDKLEIKGESIKKLANKLGDNEIIRITESLNSK